MDNVTHTLFAVTLARTALGRAGRGTMAALVVASNIPDIDIVATARGGVNYLRWHRGPTHGPLGIIGLGLAAAAIVWLAYRVVDRRGRPPGASPDAPFYMLAALGMIGALLHVLMDLPTSYGTRVLSPFDWHWFAVDWMPIVDVYLLMVLIAMLGFGRPSADMHRRKAAIALAFMAANYGVRAFGHHEALSLAPRLFGPTLPQRCDLREAAGEPVDRWPRPQPSTAALEPGRRCLMEIAAMPTFTSPFRWRIVAQMSNAYEIHDIDLLDARFRDPDTRNDAFWRTSLRYPNQWSPVVEKAAATTTAQVFLGFSRFPAARVATDRQGIASVRWNDIRFVGGVIALDQPVRAPGPFEVNVRVAPDGSIIGERLGR